MRRRSICLLFLLCILVVTLRAQEQSIVLTESTDTLGVFGPKVWYFPINKTNLLRNHLGNARMFDALDSLLSIPNVSNHIDSVFIVAAASPIGRAAYNQYLSEARAQSLKEYIRRHHPHIVDARISTQAIGMDEDGYNAIYEKERAHVDAMTPQQRRTWLLKEVYPRLQYVSIRVLLTDGTLIHPERGSPLRTMLQPKVTTYDTIRVQTYDTIRVTVYDTIKVTPPPAPAPIPTPVDTSVIIKKVEKPSTFLLVIKTNLLYDLALLPNLALEYSLTPRYSVAVEGYWSWWDTRAPDYWSYRIQVVGAEAKYWLGSRLARPRLTGHYLGIYAMMGNYDVRLFPRSLSDMGYVSTLNYSGGITYGYVLPVGKRWDLEFSLGVGYVGGKYHEYNRSICADCYPIRSDKEHTYYGPTRAAVSLIYRIGMPHETE
ncbi:MAG: DUF3575 domain-containing protein [Prevotellaceae bacterium]|jgi:hypothetical protein|nr:DUF3575 domain-containing protein [Prevotellaceae bacterium]